MKTSSGFQLPGGDYASGLEHSSRASKLLHTVPSAFVSYAHADQEFVLALIAELEAEGLDIRYDQVALHIGDSLIQAIAEEIANGDFLIAVVSPDALESEWCRTELAMARTQGIKEKRVKLLPVRYGGAEIPEILTDLFWGDADKFDIPTLAKRLGAAMNAQLRGRGQEAVATAAEAVGAPSGEPPHAEVPGDMAVAGVEGVAARAMDVLAQWERCRAGEPTVDLSDKQRRLRWALDRVADDVRAALPLAGHLADAEWEQYFRVAEPSTADADLREELRSVRSQVAHGLPLVRRWLIVRDHGEVSPGDRDAVAYSWEIGRRGDENRTITVYISGTAMASHNEGLPHDVAAAKNSRGRSVVGTLAGVDDPPGEVSVSTAGISRRRDEFWDNLRANTEIQVHQAGEGGVRLNGGPMDGWLVKRDAPSLAPDWYRTWPPNVRAADEPGRYELAESGTWAQWTPLNRQAHPYA